MIYYKAIKKIKGPHCFHGGIGSVQIARIVDINVFFREFERMNKTEYENCGCELEIKTIEEL